MKRMDREKVINGLEHCINNSDNNCYQCPYSCQCEEGYYTALKEDAFALLKEQEEQINRLEYSLAVAENNLNYYINGND